MRRGQCLLGNIIEQIGTSEVEDQRLTITRADHDVRRFEIAVNHLLSMRDRKLNRGSLSTRRGRWPRERRRVGVGEPSAGLAHRAGRSNRDASGGAGRVGALGGVAIGSPRTPNVPARSRGVGAAVLMGRSGRRPTCGGRVTPLGSRGPASIGGLRAPVWAAAAGRARRCARIWSITDACVMNATIRIALWQVGQASGSTSKICCRNAAHRRVASLDARRGARTIAGGPSMATGAALTRIPRGRLAYQP